MGNENKSILEAFAELGDAISRLGDALSIIFTPICEDIIRIFTEVFPLDEKQAWETWNEYLARVPDAPDNPEIRWEYQKHVWAYPIRLIGRLRKWHDRQITEWIL